MGFTRTVSFGSYVKLGMAINQLSLALPNPGDANQVFFTDGSLGSNRLYTLQLSPSSSSEVTLTLNPGPARPHGIAVDGTGAVYLSKPVVDVSGTSTGGIFKLPSAQTGTPELNFGLSGPGLLNTPGAMALGPDGLLYVLDTGDGRVVSFDTDGIFQNAFSLSGPTEPRALAIGDDGRLYTMNSDGGGYIYDIYTGFQVGSLADTGDVGFNPGGRPSLWIEGDYLYSTSGSGENVYVYAVPEPSAVALLLAGMAAFFARKQRRHEK